MGAASPPGSAEAALIARGRPSSRRPPRPPRPPDVPDRLDESYPRAELDARRRSAACSAALGRLPVGDRIVTLSADVAMTTHLAGWINRKGVYVPAREARCRRRARRRRCVEGVAAPASTSSSASRSTTCSCSLGAFGLTRELSGTTLLPIGTLYDPFVTRGLDALYHALYAGARFIVAATPSGVSLSPEGGAHQSVITPGIGVALPAHPLLRARLRAGGRVDPARRRCADSSTASDGESLYLRLSTKPVDQALAPPPSPDAARARCCAAAIG